MSEYSIVEFLQALSDDSMEKKLVRLISEGYIDEQLLLKILLDKEESK